MVADWVEMTSTTGGTGTLTLSSVTGSPGFADVFGATGTRWVQYTVDEYTDGTRATLAQAESGIGALVLSTLVLTRTKILSTWNGTAYATASPGAITFGTTAANIRVVCSPLAETPGHVMPWVQTAVGDGMGVSSAHLYVNVGTFTGAANLEAYVPFLWGGTGDVVQGSIYVTTAVASTAVKTAVYEVGSDGLPGRKLFDIASGTPHDTTATGAKVATVAQYLPPGWYYGGLVFSGAAVLRGASSAQASPAGTSGGSSTWCMSGTGSYATGLPATRSIGLGINIASAPAVYLKARN